MEDQGKRLLLAVGIVAALYLVWMLLFPPQPPPARPPDKPAVAEPKPAQPAAPTPTPAEAAPTGPDCAVEPLAEAPRWETAEWTATFSRCSAGLRSFQLKGKQYQVNGVPMDMVRTAEDPALFPLRLHVDVPGAGGGTTTPVIPERAQWELTNQTDDAISFRWRSADGALQATKTFRRSVPSRYAFVVEVEVKNISAKEADRRVVEASVSVFGYQDPMAPERGMFTYAEPWWEATCYTEGKLKHTSVKDLATGARAYGTDVRWGGVSHQYFLVAAAPLGTDTVACKQELAPAVKRGVIHTRLSFTTPSTLEPGQSMSQALVVYAGPKLHGELETIALVNGKETHLAEAVDLGWFSFIARPMLWLLKLFHGWVGNWGAAIILLTITVKLLTLYWTTKSMRSMKAMSKLKPEFDKIREKYPNDKQRQQLEMMNLYKAHKISPLGGCLPLLLQMPIWFALYQTLSAAAELYHAPFVGWIQDLTVPDPYYVIPVVLTAMTFVQTKLSPAAVDSQQQKIMQYMMPAMLGFFSLVFPSGLGVYMLTNTMLSMAHQYWMNRQDKLATAAAPAKKAPDKAEKTAAGKKA